jgi:hypothetical protein
LLVSGLVAVDSSAVPNRVSWTDTGNTACWHEPK